MRLNEKPLSKKFITHNGEGKSAKNNYHGNQFQFDKEFEIEAE